MDLNRIKILLIEDDEDDFVLVKELLLLTENAHYSLDWARTYEEGLELLRTGAHDACLLDYRLGARNGLDLIHEATASGCDKPIIVLTSQVDRETDLKAMRSGASDYLPKAQLTSDVLERSIRYSIAEKEAQLQLGKYRGNLEDLVRERTAQLEAANERLIVEVAERKKAEESIREQKEFLANVIESLHHPFYVINAGDYTVEMANSAAAPEGLPPNMTCHALTHKSLMPCAGENHVCPLNTIVRTRRPLTTEHVHFDHLGNERYVEVHGHPIMDAKGDVIQIVEYSLDITERKLIEEELRRTNDALAREKSLLNAVLNQMRSGVIVVEPGGRVILSNDRAGEILEYEAGHREEYSLLPIFSPGGDPCGGNGTPLRRSLEKGEIVNNVEMQICLPGCKEPKTILVSSSPVRDAGGNIVASVLSFHDITERKRAEEELYQREREYRALVENSPDVVMRVDRELRRVYANQALETVTGKPLSSFVGTTIFEPVVEERRVYVERMEKACLKVFATGDEEAFEFSYPTSRGTRHFHMRVVPEYSRGGHIESVLTISRDVTEFRQIREELQSARDELEIRVQKRTAQLAESNRALRLDEARLEALWELGQIAESSTEEIAEFTLRKLIRLTGSRIGVLGFVNEEENVFTVYASSHELNACGYMGAPCDIQIEKSKLLSEIVSRRSPVLIEDLEKSGFNEIYPGYSVSIRRFMSVPIIEAERVVFIAMTGDKDEDYDSSDMRQLTLLLDGMWKIVQRKRAEKALRQSENLAAMGSALSAVAHDIKTPLIAIGGFTRLVLGHLDEQNPDRAKLGVVVKEVYRLENLLKQILDFSRPLKLDKSCLDLNQVLEESLMMVADAARRGGLVIEKKFADLPLIGFDPMRMKQVLINLVMNAIQASSPGKKVSITTRLRKKRLLIDVADEGVGIPVPKRDEIFNPFVSTKKEGSGLGLAISKKIVEAHKGTIEILDNTPRGVILRISFPVFAGEQVRSEAA